MIKRATIEDSDNIYCFDTLCDDQKYGELRMEKLGEHCHLHFIVTKWNSKIFKENIKDFKNGVVPFAKKIGCKKIVTSFNKNTGDGNVEKWKKYIKHLGMPEPEVSYISVLEV